MTVPVTHDSSWQEISAFLLVTFNTSWLLWFFGIKADAQPLYKAD